MTTASVRAPAIRWAILTVYAVLAACTQLLWLTFAAIDTDSAKVLHVDVGTIGDLAAIFPFIYVVLALPGRSLARLPISLTRSRRRSAHRSAARSSG